MPENWLKLEDVSPHKVTPMIRQFMQAKAECGDSLLFFRMGDFYELFFEDALEAAQLLGLTLTSRDGAGKEARIPMAGVPVRSVDQYVAKAIKAGRTITICDQIEDPKLAKGIVQRAVIRTITPGTVIEPELLDERANNYLGAITIAGDAAGLAFVDVTTGEFLVAQVTGDVPRILVDELIRMRPVEVLVAKAQREDLVALLGPRFDGLALAGRPDLDFDGADGQQLLLEAFELATLKGVDLEEAQEASGAAGAILSYLKQTQRDMRSQLQLPRRYSPAGFVVLDGNTQRNLELIESLADKKNAAPCSASSIAPRPAWARARCASGFSTHSSISTPSTRASTPCSFSSKTPRRACG